MTTWIEIADTAIKIGLGAIIAGGFALIKDFMQEKKEHRKFYLEQNHKIVLDITNKIAAFHEQLRYCACNQIQDSQLKFQPMWEQIKLVTEASTYLLFLGLDSSQKELISYVNQCENYIGQVQNKINNGHDGYQNRVEPLYQELTNTYQSLIPKIKNEFNTKH